MFKPFAMMSKSDGLSPTPVAAQTARSYAQTAAMPPRKTYKPIIGVLGAKGGVGATTTAINLAAAFARQFEGKQATLVDTNLQQPDVAILAGVDPRYSILDLIERSEELDAAVVNACSSPLSPSNERCRLISPPKDGSAGVRTNLSAFSDCLSRMRDASDFWLLDLPKHLDRHLVTLMDKCDQIVVVFEPTIPAINAAQRWQRLFAELGYAEDKIVWATNRAGGKIRVVEKQLEQVSSFGVIYRIPNAFELTEQSTVRGEPAVVSNPRAPYSVTIAKLAQLLNQKVSENV